MRAHVRTIWKLATLMFALVSCLLAHTAPALAISTSSYFASASLRIDRCNPLVLQCVDFPAGTGLTISLASGSGFTPPPILTGDATSSSGVGWNPRLFTPFPPFDGSVGASTQGIATTPPDSFASSFASGVFTGLLFNHNNTTQTFPVFLSFSTFAGSTPAPYPFAAAHAHSSFQFLVDGDLLLTGADRITGDTPFISLCPSCPPFIFFIPFTEALLLTFPLTPGVHSFRLEVEAEGFAYAGTATPEPMTLLLFGTTAAGLGLARWRHRRREHAA
jgi:hypothetical protein